LVVTLGLTGVKPLTLAARYLFMKEWARAAKELVYIAIAPRSEMIDARKFGATVAANAGLILDVFTTEEQALAWLLRIPMLVNDTFRAWLSRAS
jgi:hypothetical protein